MADRTTRGVPVSLDLLKTIIDWTLKITPIAAFLIQFYLNQDRVVDKSKRDDDRITKLETDLNLLGREVVQVKIDMRAMAQRQEDQEKYGVLIGKK